MQYRKEILINNELYHIYTRSIAKFKIFNADDDYLRFIEMIYLYQFSDLFYRYSQFERLLPMTQSAILNKIEKNNNRYVDIIAYCLMPTHVHLILKQVMDNGISIFMAKLLNSYAKFFNSTHGRIGPLYEGRFKNTHIGTDEQLLHTTRYLHLNATSAELVTKPEDWPFSSYLEYLGQSDNHICNLASLPDFKKSQYQKFVNDQKDYQRSLQIIKNQLIDS